MAAWHAIDAAMRGRSVSRFSPAVPARSAPALRPACAPVRARPALTGAAFTARVRGPNGSASKPLRSSSAAIVANSEHLLRQSDRSAPASAGAGAARCSTSRSRTNFFKQHALMRDMLIDDPQTFFIHRQDERLASWPSGRSRANPFSVGGVASSPSSGAGIDGLPGKNGSDCASGEIGGGCSSNRSASSALASGSES